MNRFFKFAVLTLLLTIGGIPLLASASWSNKATAGMPCSPGCPMMEKAAHTTAVEETKAPLSCCNVLPSKPVPVAELQVPTSWMGLAVQPDVEIVGASLVSFRIERDVDRSLPDTASAQSLLCTFLI